MFWRNWVIRTSVLSWTPEDEPHQGSMVTSLLLLSQHLLVRWGYDEHLMLLRGRIGIYFLFAILELSCVHCAMRLSLHCAFGEVKSSCLNHPFLAATKDLEAGERNVSLLESHILPVWSNVLQSECACTVCHPLDDRFVPVCQHVLRWINHTDRKICFEVQL